MTQSDHAYLRMQRMIVSRKKGTHTKEEWLEMKAFFNNTCVRCLGESGLSKVEKDHIIPVYQEGSDGIDNIQPMCARCNASKGSEAKDFRPRLARLLKKELPLKYVVKCH